MGGGLECPKAVILERKPPAILGDLDALVAARPGMAPEAWRAQYGRPFLRIVNDILPLFGAAAWERARRSVEQQAPLIALPAGVFDG